MKELIVLCGVILILMTFPIQYALNVKNHYLMSHAQHQVQAMKEEARQIGYVSTDMSQALCKTLSEDTGISSDDIAVVATGLSERKTRGELIYYKVSIPMKRLIASNAFWGINDSDNSGEYVIEGYAASEWISK